MTTFSWTKQWYPVLPISYLEGAGPIPVTLLGKNLVLWRNAQNQWVAMDDRCPHKLAQLSLGHVNTQGQLVCRHHGWEFDGSGKCVAMPMIEDEKALSTACHSDRACIPTYPTQSLQGLLWVWPDAQTGPEEWQNRQPAVMPDCGFDTDSTDSIDWGLSDVPVGYTVSVESSFDPSHAQFLHEGIAGFSPATAIPMAEYQLEGTLSATLGFTLKHSGYNQFNQGMEATRQFTPPCANTTIYRYPNGKAAYFQLYFVPTQPGHCRYIVKFVMGGPPPKPKFWLAWLPTYLQKGLAHSLNYRLSDQDLAMMYSQTVNEAQTTQSWQQSYFLPAVADYGILTFRKWLTEFAGGGPDWQGSHSTAFQPLTDEQLYDRWHRHTKHCPSCRQSVLWLEQVKNRCQLGAVMLGLMTGLLIFLQCPLAIAVLPGLFGFILGVLSQQIEPLRHRFLSSLPHRGLPIVKLFPEP